MADPSLHGRFKTSGVTATSATGYTVGFTANSKTASTSITIADGDSPTGAETGNAIASLAAEVNFLKATVDALVTDRNSQP